MDELLKKLELIERKIGAIENRLGKVEALSVATSQKVVALKAVPATSRPLLKNFNFRISSEVAAAILTLAGFFALYMHKFDTALEFGYFVYMLILTIGILSLSLVKMWRWPIIASFAGATINLAIWCYFYYTPDKLTITLYVLAVFGFLHLLTVVAYRWLSSAPSGISFVHPQS